MPDSLYLLIPGAPWLVALLFLGSILSGQRFNERQISNLALTAAASSFFLLIIAWTQFAINGPFPIEIGLWGPESVGLRLGLLMDGTGLLVAGVSVALGGLVLKFARNYLHREQGFLRAHLLLCVFIGAMTLISLGSSLPLLFVGWELAGLCSALLIAFYPDRPNALGAGLRALLSNRIGDAGLWVAMALLWGNTGWLGWAALREVGGPVGVAFLLCIWLAACVKAGIFPFSPWLARAVEGPTPTSALFYGALLPLAGAVLLARSSPLLLRFPLIALFCAIPPLLTIVYGWLVSLSRTDIKSVLIHAAMSQIGLGFSLILMGFRQIGIVLLCAHAILRCYQILRAPSYLMESGARPIQELPDWLKRMSWLWKLSHTAFGLEALHHAVVVSPLQRLATRLDVVEVRMLARATGLPQRSTGDEALDREQAWTRAGGILGRVLEQAAAWAGNVEGRYVETGLVRGVAEGLVSAGRHLGALEEVLAEPMVALAITLLVLAGLWR